MEFYMKYLRILFVIMISISFAGCSPNDNLYSVQHGQLVRITENSELKQIPKNSPIFSASPLVCDILTPKEYAVNAYPETIYFVDFKNKQIFNIGGDLLYKKEIVNMSPKSISIVDRDSNFKSSINIDLKTGFYTEMSVSEDTNDERYSSGYCELKKSIKELDIATVDF